MLADKAKVDKENQFEAELEALKSKNTLKP